MRHEIAKRPLSWHVQRPSADGHRNCLGRRQRDDSTMHTRWGLVLISLVWCGVVCASEQALHDLRLVAEARPVGFEYTWSDAGAERQGHDEDDRAVAVGLGTRWGWGRAGSPAQVFTGGELLAVDEQFGAGGRQGWLGRGELGMAWSTNNVLMVTAGAFAGGGWSTFTMPGGAAGDQTLSGPTVEYGLRAGLRMSLDARWSLGFEAGWLAARESYRDGGASLTAERSGGWLGLSLGYTLSTRPRAID